jgi:hypothetical protein
MRGLLCRLLNTHKWVRMETWTEEAYRCRRCGKRHYGKPPKTGIIPFDSGGTGADTGFGG